MMTALEYLQQLQVSVGFVEHNVREMDFDPFDLGTMLKQHPELWAGRYRPILPELKNLWSEGSPMFDEIELRWSKHEDIGWLAYIIERLKEIEVTLGEQFPQIIIGTLPTRRFNALALAVPDNPRDYVIALDRGLIPFLGLASVILGYFFRTERKSKSVRVVFTDGWRDRLNIYRWRRRIGVRLGDLLASYVLDNFLGIRHLESDRERDSKGLAFATGITEMMVIFVLAHELAHVHNGHTVAEKTVQETVGETTVQTYWRKWAEELSADRAALNITAMVAHKKGIGVLTACMAVVYLLSLFEMADRADNIIKTGNDIETQIGSHPPGSIRKTWLWVEAVKEDDRVKSELLKNAAGNLLWRLNILWTEARKTFFELRRTLVAGGHLNEIVDTGFYILPVFQIMRDIIEKDSEPVTHKGIYSREVHLL